MTLIKSISGIRGTIGGPSGDSLSPIDIVKYTAAYAFWAKEQNKSESRTIVIGRDARISGAMVRDLVCGTLVSMGIRVLDLGLSTTPTVEIAVTREKALGGIILTASHNPKQWNALKLLNSHGEFLSDKNGQEILRIADQESISFSEVDSIGGVEINHQYLDIHIQDILHLPLVDKEAIGKAGFTIVVDAVNSTGGLFVPALLKALGIEHIIELNCTPDGHFTHNPEPLPANLTELSETVIREKADLGIAIDPDVDRLVFMNEDGNLFGEEYTLVAVADFVLKNKVGNTVSNLSSTRALQDITELYGGKYFASSVGEVNVVEKMKSVEAVIGGEGNGGVILPNYHYGRDALVGIALFLSHLAHTGLKASELRATYPNYFLSKNKLDLPKGLDMEPIFLEIKKRYKNQPILDSDGLRIDFGKQWVHLRKSNTEPILRIYAESTSMESAQMLADQLIADLKGLMHP